MAFPADPYTLYYEIAILDTWVAISPDVLQEHGITVDRGLGDEGADLAPSSLSVVLKDLDGDYSVDNPVSPYWPAFGQNTPVRFGIDDIAGDLFTRTLSDDWGTSTSGHVWTIGATTTAYDVNGSAGTMFASTASTKRLAYLAGFNLYSRLDVFADITMTASASGDNSAGIIFGTSTSDYCAVDVNVTAAGAVRLAIRDVDDNTYLVAPFTITGLATGTYRLHAQLEGQTLRGKVWDPVGDEEPYEWQASVSNPTISRVGRWPGLRLQSGSGNTNVTGTFDNFRVRLPVAAGELTDPVAGRDTSGEFNWCTVTAKGILQRLQQGEAPLQDSLRRWINAQTSPAPVAYWPLTDGALSTYGTPDIGIHRMTLTSTLGDTKHWSDGRIVPWIPNGMSLRRGDYTSAVVDMAGTFTNQWDVNFICNADGAEVYAIAIGTGPTPGGTATDYWRIEFRPADGEVEVAPAGGLGHTLFTGVELDGHPMMVQFRTVQSGANVAWEMWLLDLVTGVIGGASSSSGALTLNQVVSVDFQCFGVTNDPVAFAHCVVWSARPTQFAINDPGMGYNGELAGDRLNRLCSEHLITFDFIGDLDDTAPMGPQYPETLPRMIQGCVEAEQGLIYEPCGTTGIALRTRVSMESQDARAALVFSDHELAGGSWKPGRNDRYTRTKVAARRRDGGEYTAEQTTGPLNTAAPGTVTGAAGVYDESPEFFLETDDQLSGLAEWAVHLGTVAESRFPQLMVNLASPALVSNATLAAAVAGLDFGDRVTLDGTENARIYQQISQLFIGQSVSLNPREHTMALNCVPASPWRVFTPDVDEYSRPDSASTVLDEAVDTAETSLLTEILDEDGFWSTDAADCPIELLIGGEHMTATAIADSVCAYVGHGASDQDNNASVTPPLAAGHAAGQLLVGLTAIHNVGTGTANAPAGYRMLLSLGNVALVAKIEGAGEGTPTFTYSGGAAGPTGAVMASFSGEWPALVNDLIVKSAAQLNPAAQNIAIPALNPPRGNCLVLAVGWKRDNWGSTGSLSGFTKVEEFTAFNGGNGQGAVLAYQIQTTKTNIAAATYSINLGSSAVSWGALVAIHTQHQEFTVTRNVNSLPGGKSHSAGDEVHLLNPNYYGR
jgi:hypothetical protein